jgi:hypothetical protein
MGVPGYAASPLGADAELTNMYQTNFSAPVSDAQMASQHSIDQTTVENAKKAAAAAEARANAFSDAKNYKVEQKDDGGYGFWGPDGKEVTAAQYAKVLGTTPDKVLADSQNPIDIQYQQDNANFRKLLQASATGDKATLEKFYSAQPALRSLSPSQLRERFQQAYPTIYGPWNGTAGQRMGSTFAPTITEESQGGGWGRPT